MSSHYASLAIRPLIEMDLFETIVNSLEWKNDHVLLHGSSIAVNALPLYPSNALQLVTLSRLTEFLYANYYAFDQTLFGDLQKEDIFNLRRRHADPQYLESLKAANPGSGYPSRGWEITGTNDAGGLFVRKNGITLFVKEGYHVSEYNLAVGDLISIRFPCESSYGMPGFYLFFGDAGPATRLACTRFYLNLIPELAPKVIRSLLKALLKAGVPYTLKIINDPDFFTRRDNTVLYVRREIYTTVARIVLRVRRSVSGAFKDAVPSLTFLLSPGVSVADNPSEENNLDLTLGNTSFGLHRMELLAKGIGEAIATGFHTKEKILESMRANFHSAGIDPERPYLNSKDTDDHYNSPLDEERLN